MKKNRGCYPRSSGMQKILLTMRFLALFLFCTAMHLSASVHSQNVVFSFNLRNATFEDLMKEIRQHSDYYFIYKDSEVAQVTKLNKRFKSVSIDEVLEECLKGTGLTYSVEDRLIIIKKNQVTMIRDTTARNEVRLIKGIVVDEMGKPLPGVTVVIKGTNTGVATSADGLFSVALSADTVTLVFTFVGMETQEVKILPLKTGEVRKDLRVVMKEDKIALEDVVVTGYANIKKSSFTGTATQVKREDILKVAGRNVIDALQVFDPSLRIMKNNLMGSDPNTLPEFYVRGRSGITGVKELDALEASDVSQFAITNNPNTPIFILDGFEVSVEKVYDFDVNRIKDITILKDAAATAMYGSRASNGVVVIETIAPRPGRFVVSYNGNYEITAPDLSSYNMMNARQNLETEWAAGIYAGDPDYAYYERDRAYQYGIYLDKKNVILAGGDYYWLSQPLTTMFNHKHSVYIEGGSDAIRFGIELRYDNQNGVMKKSLRDRIGTGLTLEYRYKGFQMQNKISYDIMTSKASPYGSFGDYTNKHPYESWKDKDGKLIKKLPQRNYGESFINPLYEATLGNFNKSNYKEWTDNLALNWYVNDYLLVKGQFAISYKLDKTKVFTDPESAKYGDGVTAFLRGELTEASTTTTRWNTNVFAAYNRLFGLHNLNFSLGFNATYSNISYSYAHYRGFPDAHRHSPAYAYEIVTKPTFTDNKTRLFGVFLMMNYSYNDIYLADFSFRYDGSSEFGTDNKWAPFWSIGAKYRISNESFMENTKSWLTDLTIRGSYGTVGNQDIGYYAAMGLYNYGYSYNGKPGAIPYQIANPDLKWETVAKADIGIHAVFFERLTLEVDYYNQRTKDMIFDVPLSYTTGFGSILKNVGEMENKGIEFLINANVLRNKDFSWDVRFTGTANKNKIIKLATEKPIENTLTIRKVGEAYNTFYMPEYAGVDPETGEAMWYKGQEGDEKTKNVNEAGQRIVGSADPKFYGGFGMNFKYKGFDFSFDTSFTLGNKVYNSGFAFDMQVGHYFLGPVSNYVYDNRWQKPGDITDVPKFVAGDNSGAETNSSRFLMNGSYLRMKSMVLGYTLPKNLMNKVAIDNLRVYISADNLFTITAKDFIGFDPQTRSTGMQSWAYPVPRNIMFGLNLSF